MNTTTRPLHFSVNVQESNNLEDLDIDKWAIIFETKTTNWCKQTRRAQNPMKGCCDYGIEIADFKKGSKFSDQLSNQLLLKNGLNQITC
jgi:ABC-type phosphate transport system substrate-binding protein